MISVNSFKEDLASYREGLLSLGFWALQIHRYGALRYKFRNRIIRIFFGGTHLALLKLSEIFLGVYIGGSAKIGRRLVIEHSGAIVIHGASVIGDDCIVRQGVTIGNKNKNDPLAAPIIGSRVNIGAGAKLLGRIRIGDDVEIGANAVVISDIPSGVSAVGVPARIIYKVAEKVE